MVGADGKAPEGYLSDDSGDNISYKNKNFCELTGLYWLWKNCSDENIGLVHYRRYFGKSNLSGSVNKIYSYKELESFLAKYDIVLPYVENFRQNAKDELLIKCCTPEIFDKLRGCVSSLHPEYLKDFDWYFAQNKSVLFNMMFCRKQLFDEYCAWLFSILFQLEKQVDTDSLDEYMQRLYGFLSERLLNIWVRHNALRALNVKVINTAMTSAERLQLIRRRITNDIIFRLTDRRRRTPPL